MTLDVTLTIPDKLRLKINRDKFSATSVGAWPRACASSGGSG